MEENDYVLCPTAEKANKIIQKYKETIKHLEASIERLKASMKPEETIFDECKRLIKILASTSFTKETHRDIGQETVLWVQELHKKINS